MKNLILLDVLKQAMLAAIYVVLVYIFQFASFGLVQFRIAELLMIFILFDKKSIIGLTIGLYFPVCKLWTCSVQNCRIADDLHPV